jgi:hypothetical protein
MKGQFQTIKMKKTILMFSLLAAPIFASDITCTGNMGGPINGNLDVPAGATCVLHWADVSGNVTVEGTLISWTSHYQKQVIVTGVVGFLNGWSNNSAIEGNLILTATGAQASGFWPALPGQTNIVRGNLIITGSTAPVYLGGVVVGGNVNIDDNTGRVDVGGVIAGKNLNCDGNANLNNSGGNTAKQKTGQCSAF